MQTTLKPIERSASSRSASLVLVGAHGVPEVWPKVSAMIKKACAHSQGALLPRDVFDNLMRAEWELWLSMWYGGAQACAVTHMWTTPRTKALTLKIVAGEGWQQHMPAVCDIARKNGCKVFYAECARDGWDRVMPKFGFTKAYTVWRLPLDVPA